MSSPSGSEGAAALRVGIVAPSSKVPRVEFELGLEELRRRGLSFEIHPQCHEESGFFAGTDERRAKALDELARDPAIDVVWCARGGYGIARLLPLLERLAAKKGPPPRGKLLVGYSDTTALLDFVRTRWKWSALHAPMPGLRRFCELKEAEWAPLLAWMGRRSLAGSGPWPTARLRFFGRARPRSAITAPLIGGNLTVWGSLVGTKYLPRARGSFLFFEDVGENLYRLDRVIRQIAQAGGLEGVKGIVLGNFLDCKDVVNQVLRAPGSQELEPLRAPMAPDRAIPAIFVEAAESVASRAGGAIPVLGMLPVGHGPDRMPLPLGATYRVGPRGDFSLVRWDWLAKSRKP